MSSVVVYNSWCPSECNGVLFNHPLTRPPFSRNYASQRFAPPAPSASKTVIPITTYIFILPHNPSAATDVQIHQVTVPAKPQLTTFQVIHLSSSHVNMHMHVHAYANIDKRPRGERRYQYRQKGIRFAAGSRYQ